MKKILLGAACLFLPTVALPAPASHQIVLERAANSSESAVQVQVISPGTGSREQLRLRPAIGSRQTSTITLKLDPGGELSGLIPTIKLTLDLLVTQVDANGDIHFRFSYKNLDVVAEPGSLGDSEAANLMRSALNPLIGINGTVVLDNRGKTKITNLDLPRELDVESRQLFEQISSSLEQLSSPLPEEAVGLGARWRVSQALTIGGINLRQDAIYEIVSLENNLIQLKVLMEQEAPAQAIKIPTTPDTAGLSANLRSFNSQGDGEMLLRLSEILPRTSSLSTRSNIVLSVTSEDNSPGITVNQNVSLQMRLESQP